MIRAQLIDISHWDGKMDFAKARAAGASGVFIKASQTVKDSRFAEYWAGAKAAGLLRGAYHFLDLGPTMSELDQAKLFVSLIKADPGELPPVCDFEQPPSLFGIPAGSPIPRGKLWNFLNYVKQETGKTPMIYCGKFFWQEWCTKETNWLQFPFWLAWYTTNEANISVPLPWTKWTFWQYTSSEQAIKWGGDPTTPGTMMDVNWFNGTVAELRQWAGAPATPPVPAPAPVPSTKTFTTAVAVNVRSGPLDTDPAIGTLPAGTIVTGDNLIGATRTHIIKPTVGWVWTDYLIPVVSAPKVCQCCGQVIP